MILRPSEKPYELYQLYQSIGIVHLKKEKGGVFIHHFHPPLVKGCPHSGVLIAEPFLVLYLYMGGPGGFSCVLHIVP